MAKYKRSGNGFVDNETGTYIPNASGNRHYQEVMRWIADGNTPDPKYTPEELIAITNQENEQAIRAEFEATIKKPIECFVGDTKYDMDADYDAAVHMNNGIILAGKLGCTTMDIVDFYNIVHTGISIIDAEAIMIQQAIAYKTAWIKKANAISALVKN